MKYLDGSPNIVDNFNRSHNQLESLEDAPKSVKGKFNCSNNIKKFTEEDVINVSDVEGRIYT